MKLSINLNKVALLRNARGENYPDLKYFANKAIDLGVDGLTLHPRPDHRHATSNDVIEIAKLSKNRGVEFNIEGNPFSKPNNEFLGFCELVEIINPDQITLVPDAIDQITSDHGWYSGSHDNDLKNIIMSLKAKATNPNISLFIDNLNGVEYAHDMGADHIEIHTAKFSKAIQNNDTTVLNEIQSIVDSAINMNLKINAGHDLNLKNLHYLVEMGNINEVSIGHAIIIDSLLYGFEETISKYLKIIRK
jgi:pyridoxine 5-phosphate synthase